MNWEKLLLEYMKFVFEHDGIINSSRSDFKELSDEEYKAIEEKEQGLIDEVQNLQGF